VAVKIELLAAVVIVSADSLQLMLTDGRELSAPLACFPRLMNATPEQRKNWRLIGGGVGVSWLEIDEDVSVESLLAT
jgi:hypothetical protein